MTYISDELAQELEAARQRLQVQKLDEAALIAQLKSAQQHNPKTGYYVDATAVCVLGEEFQRRRLLKLACVQGELAHAVPYTNMTAPQQLAFDARQGIRPQDRARIQAVHGGH